MISPMEGKVVIVTGGGSGSGYATALLFPKEDVGGQLQIGTGKAALKH